MNFAKRKKSCEHKLSCVSCCLKLCDECSSSHINREQRRSKELILIKLMDKLIEDLNLTALERNAENLTKVSLQSDRTPSPMNLPINDDFYCVDGRLNHHLEKG